MESEVHPPHRRGTIEDRQVVAWRCEQLVAAGFGPVLTEELAWSWSIDLHALVALVERGCPPELAARILAPLDAER